MKDLICPNCGARKLKIKETMVTLNRGSFHLQIKGVPAQVCGSCREEFLPAKIAESISELAEKAYLKVSQARKVLQPVS